MEDKLLDADRIFLKAEPEEKPARTFPEAMETYTNLNNTDESNVEEVAALRLTLDEVTAHNNTLAEEVSSLREEV